MSLRKVEHACLGEYALNILQSANYDEAFHSISALSESLGFDGILYTYIPRFKLDYKNTRTPMLSVSESYNHAFIEHYMQAGFADDDAMVKAISNGETRDMNWWQVLKKNKLTRAEEYVLKTARHDYGVNNGLTIPLLCNEQAIAGMSVISSDSDDTFARLIKHEQQYLKRCISLFHQKVMLENWKSEVFVQPLLGGLNYTEKRVLQGLVSGLSAKIIAPNCGISEKYVEKTVRTLRYKMAGENAEGRPAMTTAELIYNAGLLNLVKK